MKYNIDFLLRGFRLKGPRPALAWRDKTSDFAGLADLVEDRLAWAEREGIGVGTPVALIGDFTFLSVATHLALIARKAIVVPLTVAPSESLGTLFADIGSQFVIDARGAAICVERKPLSPPNALHHVLSERGSCGLVLFTSGSTGRPKAVVHDSERMLAKFKLAAARHGYVEFSLVRSLAQLEHVAQLPVIPCAYRVTG